MSSMTRSTVSLVLPLIVGLAAENAAVAQGRNAAAGTACAGLRVAVIRQYHDSVRRSHSGGCVQLADRRTSRSRRRLFEAAVVLPRLGLDQAHSGLGHPLRGVAPHGELERQVPADGKRRRSRGARPCVDGGPAVTRLCGGPHRHWPSGRTRGFRLGGRPSGELIDYQYRAVHELTVVGKAITAAHYGEAPDKSYWNGCSTGGRQGLKEAQRYPEDYDAIVAGAPASNWSALMAQSVLIQRNLGPQGSAPTSSACSRRPRSRPAMLRTA